MPSYDEGRQAALVGALREIYPDDAVREYVDGVTAPCLQMSQANPHVLMDFGGGGTGKGTRCELVMSALGPYAIQIDGALLCPPRGESAEGCKSQRAQLEVRPAPAP